MDPGYYGYLIHSGNYFFHRPSLTKNEDELPPVFQSCLRNFPGIQEEFLLPQKDQKFQKENQPLYKYFHQGPPGECSKAKFGFEDEEGPVEHG